MIPPYKRMKAMTNTVISAIAWLFLVAVLGIAFLPWNASLAAANDVIIRSPAGTGAYGYAGDNGPAVNAFFATPSSVAVDADGNLFIADAYNNRIRKVNAQGIITTFAGAGIGGYTGDGGAATAAQIDTPTSLAIDRSGSLFFTDMLNNVVRKIDASGKITTVAGNGQEGFSGDGGQATLARLSFPQSLTLDATGNLFICDTFNHRIRKVDAGGIVTTFAGDGTAGYSGDGGQATQARLNAPDGAAFDRLGNLYIADTQNFVVRKVDTTGKITTFAGNNSDGYGGDNGPATQARLSPIRGVAADAQGNIYISDPGNDRIRRVDTKGIITTIAGNGGTGYNGDGMLATQALLNEPIGVTVDPYGVIYFADSYGDRVRMLKSNQLQLFGLSQYVIQTGAQVPSLNVLGAGLEGASVSLNGQSASATFDQAGGNLAVNLPPGLLSAPGTVTVRVSSAGGAASAEKTVLVATQQQLSQTATASVSSASYQTALAPDSIAAMFGAKLATQFTQATTVPLPTALGGTKIFVNGTAAPLFFVSPNQVNYLLPQTVAPLANTSIVTVAGDGTVSQQRLTAFAEAPSLFTANASGTGGPAALWTRDGVNNFPVTNPDGTLNPIPAGAFLILFGTGIRNAPDPVTSDNNGVAETMQANFGGTIASVAYGGPQGGFVGLDQVNVQIPASLAGRGALDLVIVVNGKASNAVRVRVV